jgi:hypothetical protein
MPVAFPERGGPPPLLAEQGRLTLDLDFSSESPDGSNLSGNEGGKYGEKGFSRRQREFIPENRKDDAYWEKRRKNNEVRHAHDWDGAFHSLCVLEKWTCFHNLKTIF